MGESTASRDRYKIQRFPSGWHGYCGKTRVKDFSNSKADAQAWLDMMNRVERKPTRFTKIVNDLPKYGSGTITSAYLMEDGCVVGYCKDTKEWLKWNAKGQLHTSCGWSREDAAMLMTDDTGNWCDNNMVENAKIIAEARTKPTHSERVRAISARRDARRAKRRSANEELKHEVKVVRHQLGCAQRTAAHRLDQLVGQQNFRARYINATAVTTGGSPISTQFWCASEDDISAFERKLLSWSTPEQVEWHGGAIIRIFIFDTFTRVLHEVIADDGKLVPVKATIQKEVQS